MKRLIVPGSKAPFTLPSLQIYHWPNFSTVRTEGELTLKGLYKRFKKPRDVVKFAMRSAC